MTTDIALRWELGTREVINIFGDTVWPVFTRSSGAGSELLAHVFCCERNARLVAAAPELFAALEKISANSAESPEWIRRVAGEAIAKAKGLGS